MSLPQRKPHRLKNYAYNTPGAYFLTLCTENKNCILWERVGASIARPQTPQLSHYGRIVDASIREIPLHYPSISLDHYVVMPNHIHLLLQIHTDPHGQPLDSPTVSRVVQQLKGSITKQIGHSIWQKLFHDYVIRGEADYLKIWQYIDTNPIRWAEDCFYPAEE
jgi:REP element-mobilizing transposase RayT